MASSPSKGSLLPFDILESILCRVPAESLNRFKSVCKRWFDLLKDKNFVYNHLDLVQEHFVHLFNEMVQIVNPDTNTCFSTLFPDKFGVKCRNSVVMHCNGLLLRIINDDSSKLAVWNPLFNQVRWILKPNGNFKTYHTYGFGYDNTSCDNYKILWFCTDNPDNPMCEIYEFKSNSWKALDVPFDFDWPLARWFSHSGVSLKGNMYWISESKRMFNTYIECFDFSTETFKFICPFPFDKGSLNDVLLSAYKEDKLSLLRQQSKPDLLRYIEVWITNHIKDRVVSWIKLFAVSSPDLPVLSPMYYFWSEPYFIDKNTRINVMSSEVEIVHTNGDLYDIVIIGKGGFQINIFKSKILPNKGYKYLPSLVRVPQ